MSLPPGLGGKPLELSLDVLDAIGEAGMVILPDSPTPGMLRAATRVAGVDEITARKIYQAMVREAE